MYSPPCSDVCTHRYFTAKRLTIGPSRPATTAATMTRMETRNGPSEPPSSATQRWCGLSSGSCRPDVATARRAGWRRPQETATVRGRAGPLLSALARVQKTREAPFGTSPKSGRAAAVAGRILASHNRTIPRLFSLGAAPATVLQPCATDQITKRRAALLQTKKSCSIQFCTSCAGRYDATDGVSAGHLRPCCRLAAGPRAASIARREAGTARRPSTRARWREGGGSREPAPSPRRLDGVSVEPREI